VADVDELASYLDDTKQPGDSVELLVERDGERLPLVATLAEWPA
jgi:S1-C subfamily serine protease